MSLQNIKILIGSINSLLKDETISLYPSFIKFVKLLNVFMFPLSNKYFNKILKIYCTIDQKLTVTTNFNFKYKHLIKL